MKYLNAEKGIKKVYLSQLFAIFAAVLIGGTEMLTAAYKNIFNMSASELKLIPVLSVIVGVILLGAVITSLIIGMIGYYQASKDELLFRNSIFCALISGALTLVGELFQIPNGMLYTIFTTSATIVEMFVMVFAISGILNLSENCGRGDLSEKGGMLLKIMLVIYIISAVNALIIRIFELSDKAKIVSFIINAIDSVLIVTRYMLYLKYLHNSIIMLRENNT